MRAAALALAAAAALAAAPAWAATSDKKLAAGAYCPLPKGDEPPACLQGATESYGAFFAGLASGEMDEAAAAQVERDLASEQRYEALSSLSYAYYLLSRRAASPGGEVDPAVSERLQRWNAILGETYRASADRRFRDALRTAAQDLSARAPAIPLVCTEADGTTRACTSTEAVVGAVADARDHTGVRGAVERLLERALGEDPARR